MQPRRHQFVSLVSLALVVAALVGNALAQSRQESGRLGEGPPPNLGTLRPELPVAPTDADAARLQKEADAARTPAEIPPKPAPPRSTFDPDADRPLSR